MSRQITLTVPDDTDVLDAGVGDLVHDAYLLWLRAQPFAQARHHEPWFTAVLRLPDGRILGQWGGLALNPTQGKSTHG